MLVLLAVLEELLLQPVQMVAAAGAEMAVIRTMLQHTLVLLAVQVHSLQ
jgi:hypothetical protein